MAGNQIKKYLRKRLLLLASAGLLTVMTALPGLVRAQDPPGPTGPVGAPGITAEQCEDKYHISSWSRFPSESSLTPELRECLRLIAERDNNEQAQRDNNERFKALREGLEGVFSRNNAQRVFLGDTNEGDPGGLPKLNIDSGKDSGKFIARGNARLGSKYDGNPYFSVGSNHVLHFPDGDLPSDENRNVRFVLTEIHWMHQSNIETFAIPGQGGQEKNVYVFRNEYNPNLALYLQAKDAIGDGLINAVDAYWFTYAPSCEEHTEENWISDIDWGGSLSEGKYFNGVGLSDTDDESEIHKVADEFNNINICGKNNSIFAGAMQQALTSVKNATDGIFVWIKDALLNVIEIGTLSDNRGLTEAWKTIRDFVNLIFILLMVAIAFSNILRIDTDKYGVRALLPRLVFGVIAVNFSFILVQIMVNVAYVVGQPFAEKAFNLIASPPADSAILDPSEQIGQFIVALLLVIAVIIGFVILFFFFVVRILMIWMLTALSPFVFLFMILPLTRSLASSWWKNAMKWIFMAPVAFILLFVAAELLGTQQSGQDVQGPDYALRVAFFVGAAIAAVMIPLKLGGEVMSRAGGGAKKAGRMGFGTGKGLGGFAARKSGLAAANEQRKQRAERKQALRGAGIREGFNKRLSAATGGRLGTEAATEAQAQQRTAQEKEAELFANQFNSDEIGEMQQKFKPGSRMHETLGLAHDIRTGAFSERRKGEQLANEASNFAKKPVEAQRREIQDLGSRNVTQFSPNVLEDLATTQDPERDGILQEHLSSGALEGALDQNSPARISALRNAHENGRISQGAIDSLDNDHRQLFNERILGAQSGQGGQRSTGAGGPRVSKPGPSGPRTSGTSSGGVVLPESRGTKEPPNPDDIRRP